MQFDAAIDLKGALQWSTLQALPDLRGEFIYFPSPWVDMTCFTLSGR